MDTSSVSSSNIVRRLLIIALVSASIGIEGSPTPAAAGVAGCSFDEETATLTVTGSTIRREADAITVDGQACGTATVTTTDEISIEGSGDLTIDLRGGPFAPGVTPEDVGVPEIEIMVSRDGIVIAITGSGKGDRIKPATDVDGGAINLNAAEVPKDPDVFFAQAGIELLLIEGRGGNDSVLAHGRGVRPYLGDVWFFAGNGNDRFVPGTPVGDGSTFVGGRGHDAFDISWLPRSRSLLVLGEDGGGAYGDPPWLINLITVEEIKGHAGADDIYGSARDDWIFGGGGRDLLEGRGGDDHIASEGRARIDAGPGDDECLVFPEVVSVERCEEVLYAVVRRGDDARPASTPARPSP